MSIQIKIILVIAIIWNIKCLIFSYPKSIHQNSTVMQRVYWYCKADQWSKGLRFKSWLHRNDGYLVEWTIRIHELTHQRRQDICWWTIWVVKYLMSSDVINHIFMPFTLLPTPPPPLNFIPLPSCKQSVFSM